MVEESQDFPLCLSLLSLVSLNLNIFKFFPFRILVFVKYYKSLVKVIMFYEVFIYFCFEVYILKKNTLVASSKKKNKIK